MWNKRLRYQIGVGTNINSGPSFTLAHLAANNTHTTSRTKKLTGQSNNQGKGEIYVSSIRLLLTF